MASRSILTCVRQGLKNQALLVNLNKLNLNTTSVSAASNVTFQPRSAPSFSQNQRSIHLSARKNATITIESPAFAESIKEGDIQFVKQVGDSVAADECIAKVETDKTTMDVMAPEAGVIEAFLVEDGSTIGPNQAVIKLTTGGTASAPAAAAVAAATSAPAQEAPKVSEPVDSKAYVAASVPTPTSMPPVPVIPTKPASVTQASQVPVTPLRTEKMTADPMKITGTRAETKVKMSKMRKTVASRLKDAQNTTAMLTTFNEINMGNLMELRKTYGDQFLKKHNLKLGFMSAFLKSAASALQDQPAVNAVISGNEIVYRDYVDISVAVATPKGLVVPVLRNVESMNYADIEKEIASLGARARDNKLAIEDMQGGTFTISNGGVFGSLFGTPIINLPQSAILGMHGIFDRPVVEKGQIVIRPMMYVALTYDHRLIDGREAVTFLKRIKTTVEDPRSLLLDI
jgi:2-oxoglutarate dehydrogenase E2 component (dihydrolipoamide succinyltransferase)